MVSLPPIRSARLPLAAVFLVLTWTLPGFCQSQSKTDSETLPTPTSSDKPAAAPSGPKPIKFGDITISGSYRTRVENFNFFDSGAADGEYTFVGQLLRLAISQKKQDYDWTIELAVPILYNLPGNAVAPGAAGQLGLGPTYFVSNQRRENVAMIFPKQAFLRFIAQDDRASAVKFGRFEFIEGLENGQKDASLGFLKRERIGHRLVGNFAFTHVGRSFDGIEFKRETPNTNFTLMAGRATRGVFQADGLGEMDVDIIYGGLTRQIAPTSKHPGEWRFFSLAYHDGRGALKVDNRTAVARAADRRFIRLETFGGHYIQTAPIGKKLKGDVLLWAALQFGSWGLQQHLASAVSVEAGLQPQMPGKPWLRAGYDRSSGDGNSSDGRHSTFFEPLGTPRIYARFPFYNHMNLEDSFAQLLVRPNPRFTVRTEYHYLRLSSANDLWYSGGGAFSQTGFGIAGRPSNGHRDLAAVVDLGFDWQIHPLVTFSSYYAHAFGRSIVRLLYPQRPDADYAYAELVLKF